MRCRWCRDEAWPWARPGPPPVPYLMKRFFDPWTFLHPGPWTPWTPLDPPVPPVPSCLQGGCLPLGVMYTGLCSHSCLLSHVPRLAPCNAGVASLIKAGSREIFPVLFE